jgi:DNA-binding transcriptional LysR family regulator
MAVDIDQVEAFIAISRGGGFRRAATALHLSQPAVSRRLELLERELGAPLFERMRSGVLLTEAGKAFLPHAEALLASMRDGIDAVRGLERAEGAVTLALVGTLAGTTLTKCLQGLREAYPRVDLRLRTALSAEVSALVRRGDAVLGLRYGADPHPDLVSSIIHDEPMVAVCSARHRLAHRRRVEPRTLAGEPWIGFPSRPDASGETYTVSLRQHLAACGLGESEIIPIDSLTAQKRMVEAGFGLALLPESSADEELRAGTLRAVRIPALRARVPIALIHRRRAYLSGAARQLMAVLTAWPLPRARRERSGGISGRGPRQLPSIDVVPRARGGARAS